ncbi:hypothetical protein [Nocardia spumae]|uniref:hypothetical protein n=1 Tax=Nocardia spumae TaxID=2887190 RepID=UPI001D132DC4|nr:hypothetical protein [Nocardia spumae]
MASGDEQGRDEGESEFGPPVSGFGPPLNDFGPPTGDSGAFGPPTGESGAFGPPTGESRSVGWSPVGEPERPNLGWQPADAPAQPSVPPPPAQYRAPDSTPAPETVRHSAPEASRAPEARRNAVPEPKQGANPARSPETVRYLDSAGSSGSDGDRGSWWKDDSGFPPAPPREKPGSLWDDDELAKKLAVPRAGTDAKAGSGSLWDDDDLAKKLAPSRPAAGPDLDETHRNRGVLYGGIGAAAVLVVALIVVIVFATRGGDDTSNNAQPGGATGASGNCAARTEGNIVYGNGPGDTSSGSNAIFGYQHAYYTERNAEKAHTFIAPGANVQPPPDLQKTIDDHIPQGTTYCLRIASTAPSQFNVEVTEHHPDGTQSLYLEVITTVNQGGRNLIQLIQSF